MVFLQFFIPGALNTPRPKLPVWMTPPIVVEPPVVLGFPTTGAFKPNPVRREAPIGAVLGVPSPGFQRLAAYQAGFHFIFHVSLCSIL